MDTASLNLLWSDGLMDGLAAAGVRRVVISPGSRSTPLVLAVQRQPRLTSWQHPDERSAAFFALGLACRERQPVALVATSGSAPAHWYPAVIEANHSGIPLLLLSADRPPELQACGANQTVDQTRLFGDQVRACYAAGCPDQGPAARRRIRALGIQAVHRALWPDPGPVHINLPFREPLTPSHWPEPPTPGPDAPVCIPQLAPEPAQLGRIRRLLSARRGLIVCGPLAPHGAFARAVTRLAARLGCPLLADPLSQLRFGGHDHGCILSHYDAALRAGAFSDGERPQWILRFGAAPVSKALLDYLQQCDAPTVLCAPRGDWPDPLHQTREMVRASPSLLCEALLEAVPPQAPAPWLARFRRVERVVAGVRPEPRDDPDEATLIGELMERLPERAHLFCGNSLPIRQLDRWGGQGTKPLHFYANRGASGIDGNISTLLGLAAAGEGPLVGLLGDLALFHDLNGLLLAPGLDGVIVLLNNGGGGIFGTLPQADLPGFEEHWLMPTGLDFGQAARLYGLGYRRVTRQAEFPVALEQALEERGCSLLEVQVDRLASLQRTRRYHERVRAGLARLPEVGPI